MNNLPRQLMAIRPTACAGNTIVVLLLELFVTSEMNSTVSLAHSRMTSPRYFIAIYRHTSASVHTVSKCDLHKFSLFICSVSNRPLAGYTAINKKGNYSYSHY